MVTGGSKGIGLEVCRLFAQHGLIVVLTARNVEQGLNAFNHIKQQLCQEESKEKEEEEEEEEEKEKEEEEEEEEEEGNLYFHQLDVTNPVSISRFASWIESTFGGLDILVNNALPPSTLLSIGTYTTQPI